MQKNAFVLPAASASLVWSGSDPVMSSTAIRFNALTGAEHPIIQELYSSPAVNLDKTVLK